MATMATRISPTQRPAGEIARALAVVATSRGRSRLRWLANTGTIAIVAIAILRWAANAVASSTAATATIGTSNALGLRITAMTAAAKKRSTSAKYFCSRLPAGAVVREAISGFQTTMLLRVVGLRIE